MEVIPRATNKKPSGFLTCNVYKYVYNREYKKILIKRLQELGWWKYGEGGSHEKWTNAEQKTAVPRHAEINEYTAEAIVKTALANPGNKRKDRI